MNDDEFVRSRSPKSRGMMLELSSSMGRRRPRNVGVVDDESVVCCIPDDEGNDREYTRQQRSDGLSTVC